MRLTLLAPAFLATVLGCFDRESLPVDPLSPSVSPTPVEQVEALCASACTNLRLLGCPEGKGAISGETCERRCAIASGLRPMPLACWADAVDVVVARSCGSLRCTR